MRFIDQNHLFFYSEDLWVLIHKQELLHQKIKIYEQELKERLSTNNGNAAAKND